MTATASETKNATPPRPLPTPTDATRAYWEAAAEGRLVVQSCPACGHLQFYPRVLCTACMSDRLAWQACSGKGTIYTYTINHRALNPYMKGRTPYAVAIVELEEGVRMMANILDSPLDEIAIGKAVEVLFENAGEVTLPQFRLQR